MAEATLTLTLNGDAAERLGRIMRAGDYESYEAVLEAALESLEASSEPPIESWLEEVVARRFDAYQAGPSRAVPFEEARQSILGRR